MVDERNGKDFTDDDLMRLLEKAMADSLKHGVDPRDLDLIPASESFKGMFPCLGI